MGACRSPLLEKLPVASVCACKRKLDANCKVELMKARLVTQGAGSATDMISRKANLNFRMNTEGYVCSQ